MSDKQGSRRRLPRPATVLAAIAVFAVLAGTATAAGGLISGSKIKKGTITGKQIKNKSLSAAKLSPAALKQLRGSAASAVPPARRATPAPRARPASSRRSTASKAASISPKGRKRPFSPCLSRPPASTRSPRRRTCSPCSRRPGSNASSPRAGSVSTSPSGRPARRAAGSPSGWWPWRRRARRNRSRSAAASRKETAQRSKPTSWRSRSADPEVDRPEGL